MIQKKFETNNYWSSHRRCSIKNGVLKNFAKIHREIPVVKSLFQKSCRLETEKDVMNRSSHQRCSLRKGFLRNFVKFTGKHLWQSLFFKKTFCSCRLATLLKKRLWHRCFPLNFTNFLKASFSQNTSGRLLLYEHLFLGDCFLNYNIRGLFRTLPNIYDGSFCQNS